MVAIRHCEFGTVESGSLADSVRIELADRHMWLYPEAGAAVRVEYEAKDGADTFPHGLDANGRCATCDAEAVGSGRLISPPPCDCETCLAAEGVT